MLTLDQYFALLTHIRKEKLHGRAHGKRWTLHRYEVEIHHNGLGSWTVSLQDWKRVGPQYEPRDAYGLGIDKDIARAIHKALVQLDIPVEIG